MERNISVWLLLVQLLLETWPATQACAPTGNQTSDSGSEASTQSTEPHQSGCLGVFKMHQDISVTVFTAHLLVCMHQCLPQSGEKVAGQQHRWKDELGLDHFLKCKAKELGHKYQQGKINIKKKVISSLFWLLNCFQEGLISRAITMQRDFSPYNNAETAGPRFIASKVPTAGTLLDCVPHR